MQETWFQFLGQEDPPEKEMATHSSILAWRIPWTEPWRATVHGVTRVGHDLVTKPPPPSFSLALFMILCFHVCVRVCVCACVCYSFSCIQLFETPRGSSVHGISQARILKWVAMLSSRESSWFWDWTHVSCESPALQMNYLPLGHWGSPQQGPSV